MLATAALVLLAVAHAAGLWSLAALHRLDEALYDRRLQLTMPQTLDERIVIIDIDERSPARVGQWPWSRARVARSSPPSASAANARNSLSHCSSGFSS